MLFNLIKKRLNLSFAPGAKAGLSTSVDYRDHTISPSPHKSAGVWSTEGDITRNCNGDIVVEHFIRAETHANYEQAIDHTISKAKRIIDEQIVLRDGPRKTPSEIE